MRFAAQAHQLAHKISCTFFGINCLRPKASLRHQAQERLERRYHRVVSHPGRHGRWRQAQERLKRRYHWAVSHPGRHGRRCPPVATHEAHAAAALRRSRLRRR